VAVSTTWRMRRALPVRAVSSAAQSMALSD
jgi:hypothetical protein